MSGDLWTPDQEVNEADFDFRLTLTLTRWFQEPSHGAAFSSGLEVGMALAMRHPEWAQFCCQEMDRLRDRRGWGLDPADTPGAIANIIVEQTPAEAVTDDAIEPINGL